MINITATGLMKTQIRVIGALVMRETRVTYGNAQFGYLWAFLNPLAGVAILVVIFSFIAPQPPIGTNHGLFISTGFLLFSFYTKLSGSLMHVINANRPTLNYPLVNTTDVIAARIVLIVLTEFVILLVFFTGLTLISDDVTFPDRVEEVVGAVMAVCLLGIGVGLCNMVIFGLWKTWSQIEGLLSRPLFFVSGIFFVPSRFSPDIQYWLSWNPLLHCIEWIRQGYYASYESTLLDRQYLLLFVLTAVALGAGCERLYRKHLL